MANKDFFNSDEPAGDFRDPREDQQINDMIAQAMDQVEKGANPEAVLGAILESLPAHQKEKVKKRFQAVIDQRRQKETKEKPKGLKALASLFAKQTLDKIISVLRSRPDVQRKVQEAGKTLMRNGVVVDMVRVAENDLGTLAPMVGVAQQKDQTVQR
jgi:hypothetical protein